MVDGNFTSAGLSVADGLNTIQPLILYAIAMVLYAIFVFKFYKFLAKRDIFKLELHQYYKTSVDQLKDFMHIVFYILEYIVIFPLFAFFWFFVLTVLLIFMSQAKEVNAIIIISAAIVAAVRILSYYKEELAMEISKLVPLTLLAVFISSGSSLTFTQRIDLIKDIPGLWQTCVYCLILFVMIEVFLRIVNLVLAIPDKKKDNMDI